VQLEAPARRLLAICLISCVVAARALPAAAAEDESAAEKQARTYFVTGEYKQALDIYARLYLETNHPTYLRNIGRCQQNLGEADKAIASFHEYLRKAKDLSADQRAEIEGYIAEMEQLKRSRAGAVAPPPAPEPSAAATPLVGPPTVVAAPAGDEGAAPFYTRAWFWIGVAVVVAGAATTAFLVTRDRSPTHGDLGFFDTRNVP
jgi:tetratricopeptide (TPR) repeat protein